jgi:hypothetical protein
VNSSKKEKNTKTNNLTSNNLLAISSNFYPFGSEYLKEGAKRETAKIEQSIYFCPECGKPLENVSATESHLNDTYELHLTAWHGKLHAEAH